MIAEGKMNLSQVAMSRYTSMIDVMKLEEKLMVRSTIKERIKQAQGSMMEL